MSDADRLQRTLKDATLVPVAGARTFVPLDQPEVVADAIAAFVDARPVRTDSSSTTRRSQ
jgi:pimeloyl-ACP methyl ester carboxylesterase